MVKALLQASYSKHINKTLHDLYFKLSSNKHKEGHMGQLKSINADVIENLKSLGGMDLLAELNIVFIRTSEELIKDIHKAISTNDSTLLQEKAHSLKSSSGNMGALQLSEICMQLEKIGHSKNLSQAQALAQSLDSEFKQASLELSEIVKGN